MKQITASTIRPTAGALTIQAARLAVVNLVAAVRGMAQQKPVLWYYRRALRLAHRLDAWTDHHPLASGALAYGLAVALTLEALAVLLNS